MTRRSTLALRVFGRSGTKRTASGRSGRPSRSAIVSAISPYREGRDEVRARITNFLEVYVNAPLGICEERDVKGLYRRARSGEIPGFTGIDDPYEPPLSPEVECRTDRETIAESAQKIVDAVEARLAESHGDYLAESPVNQF